MTTKLKQFGTFPARKELSEKHINSFKKKIKTEREILSEEAGHRATLSWILITISILWLGFTGIIIWQYGRGYLQYDSATSVSFILGSLAEVFALWKISLSYFFSVK